MRGNIRIPDVKLRYYRSTNSKISAGDDEEKVHELGAVDAYDDAINSTSLDSPPEPGTYHYGVCVDTFSGEANTQDNCSAGVPVTFAEPEELTHPRIHLTCDDFSNVETFSPFKPTASCGECHNKNRSMTCTSSSEFPIPKEGLPSAFNPKGWMLIRKRRNNCSPSTT